MDAVVGLLDGVRARGAFVLRMVLDPPWSMRIQDDAPLTLICQTTAGRPSSATAAERLARARRRRADPGHRALSLRRRPGHRAAGRHPSRQPLHDAAPVTTCGSRCRWGCARGATAPAGPTGRSICAYEGRSEVSARLLDALPTVLVLRATNGRPRWSICWPPKRATTVRARRPTSTGCSICF